MPMTAPPLADPQVGETEEELDVPRRTSGPAGTGMVGTSTPLVDDDDPEQARPDPASTLVQVGEIPPVRRPLLPRRLRSTAMPTDRLRGWIVTLLITAIGGALRFANLGAITNFGTGPMDQGAGLFDEAYYAVQAGEMLRNGGVEDNQAFGVVVHPPLGKQLIAIGEWLFGYNAFGWRFASAVAGTLCILLIIRVVRRMTRSTLVGAIAGILLTCDSVSFVMARMALLDTFQELFVLAAFTCLVVDRDQVRARLNAARENPDLILPGRGPAWWRRSGERAGLALGARWYRFGCGVFLGMTIAVKWSGLYWVAGFGLLVVLWDFTARRSVGIRRALLGTVRRDLAPALWSMVVIPFAVYIASWSAWFRSENAWARHILTAQTENWTQSTLSYTSDCVAVNGPSGKQFPQKMADLWNNALWQWTWKMLDFHNNLITPCPASARHPWESKPWSWPMGTRPVLYYAAQGLNGCGTGTNNCVGRVFAISLPAMWWLSVPVALWALWNAIARLDWRYAAVLVGYGFGYIPWFLNLSRQMYFFYVTPLAPFLVIAISLVLGDVLGRAKVGVERRYLSIIVVALYVGLVVADFAWMWPILTGSPITSERLTMETWIPSWG